MQQHIPQDEIRRIIISDMVEERNSIVPVIGEDTIVYSLCVPLILLWLSDWTLKWIRSVFKDCSKFMRENTLLMDIGALAYEASLLALRTYV